MSPLALQADDLYSETPDDVSVAGTNMSANDGYPSFGIGESESLPVCRQGGRALSVVPWLQATLDRASYNAPPLGPVQKQHLMRRSHANGFWSHSACSLCATSLRVLCA